MITSSVTNLNCEAGPGVEEPGNSPTGTDRDSVRIGRQLPLVIQRFSPEPVSESCRQKLDECRPFRIEPCSDQVLCRHLQLRSPDRTTLPYGLTEIQLGLRRHLQRRILSTSKGDRKCPVPARDPAVGHFGSDKPVPNGPEKRRRIPQRVGSTR